MTKCKHCNCNCHCSLKEHGDMYGVCSCMNCEHDECESCQQEKKKLELRIPKKKKDQVYAVKKIKKRPNKKRMNTPLEHLKLEFVLQER